MPIDDFCSSDQRFAIHCFQLSRHRDHLVDLLSLPISGRLRDLHPIDNAHAEHTQEKAVCTKLPYLFSFFVSADFS